MHLGRFNYLVWNLHQYYEDSTVARELDAVIQSLQNYASSPTLDSSGAFKVALKSFIDSVEAAEWTLLNPSYVQALEHIGGTDYVDGQLIQRVQQIVNEAGAMPTDILARLQEFRKRLARFIGQVEKLAESMDSLRVEYDKLEVDQFEFGMLFPRDSVGHSINDLADEFGHIDKLFKALNGLAGLGEESPTVRTIAASWWEVFLNADPVVLGALSLAIERIVELYKKALEIRLLKSQLEAQDLDKDWVDQLEPVIQSMVKQRMASLSAELRQKICTLEDQARANELETQLRYELVHMAKRINQGAVYEARAGLPNRPEELDEEEAEDPAKVQEYEQLMASYTEKLELAQGINLRSANNAEAIAQIQKHELPLRLEFEAEDNAPT